MVKSGEEAAVVVVVVVVVLAVSSGPREEGLCIGLGMRGRVKGPLIWRDCGGAMKSGWRRRGRESRVER